MTAIRIIFAFLAPLVIGYLVMSLIDRNRRVGWYEKSILGYFPGIGILMATMFLMGFFSIPLLFWNVCVGLGATTLILVLLLRRFPASKPRVKPLVTPEGLGGHILLSAFLLILVFKVTLAMVYTLQSPTCVWDSLERWNMRAKVFYTRGELVLDKQDSEFLGQPGWRFKVGKKLKTRTYPPHTSLYKTWVALVMGRYQDEAVNLVNPVTYGFFCLSITLLLLRILGWRRGLVGGYLFLALPFAWVHASNPYAEIFVLSYSVLACASLLLAIDSSEKPVFRWYFALSLAFLPFTKKEGMILSLIILSVYALWALLAAWNTDRSSLFKTVRSALLTIAPFGCLTLLWLVYQHHIGGSLLFRGYGDNGIDAIYYRQHSLLVFKAMLLERGSFGLFPPLLAAVTIWKAPIILKTNLKFIYLIFILMLIGVVFQLTFTGAATKEALRPTGISRALLEILPTGILAAYIAVFRQPGTDG